MEYHDPYVPMIKPTREHSRWARKKSVDWSRTNIASFDLVLIATNHASVNYRELGDRAQCIVEYPKRYGNRSRPGWKSLEGITLPG